MSQSMKNSMLEHEPRNDSDLRARIAMEKYVRVTEFWINNQRVMPVKRCAGGDLLYLGHKFSVNNNYSGMATLEEEGNCSEPKRPKSSVEDEEPESTTQSVQSVPPTQLVPQEQTQPICEFLTNMPQGVQSRKRKNEER